MSFLEQLQSRKVTLKHTDTIVTHPDGRRFLENKCNTTALTNKSFGFVVDTKPDNIPAQIKQYIYLGSQDCCDADVIRKYNIQNVLSVGVLPASTCPNVAYKFVNCLDLPDTNLRDILFNNCVEFIDKCVKLKQNILVHCNAGVSRSCAVVIGYLILICKLTYQEAYDCVKEKRGCIKPNSGFDKQLRELC